MVKTMNHVATKNPIEKRPPRMRCTMFATVQPVPQRSFAFVWIFAGICFRSLLDGPVALVALLLLHPRVCGGANAAPCLRGDQGARRRFQSSTPLEVKNSG